MRKRSLPETVWPPGLPQSVRSFLPRLPDKVDGLLEQVQRHSGVRFLRDVSALERQLRELASCLKGLGLDDQRNVATAMLAVRKGAVGLALLRLVAISVRVAPPDADPSANPTAGATAGSSIGEESRSPAATAWLRLGDEAFNVIHTIGRVPSPSPASITFLRSLLAMQTPRACARQLAAAADLLLRPPPPQLRPPKAATEGVKYTLLGAQQVFMCMTACLDAGDRPSTASELAGALRESHVLEHAARVLLRLTCSQELAGKDCLLLFAITFLKFYVSMGLGVLAFSGTHPSEDLNLAEQLDTAAHLDLADAASGPCADFLAMALGLATLCAADGGPSYGLPQEVMERLPLLTEDCDLHDRSALVPSDPVDISASPGLFICPLALAIAVIRKTRSGCIRLRTGVAVLLRLSRLGLASAQAVEMPGPSSSLGGAGRGADPVVSGAFRGVLLRPSDGAELTVNCLPRVWELLKDRPAAWADVAEEWWRLVVGLCGAPCVRLAPGEEARWRRRLGPLLTVPLPRAGLISPAPPPALSAALAAGLVPALERLIRRAGEDPDGGEAAVVEGLMGRLVERRTMTGTPRPFLSHLLAHGDPRQAAALVASLGKVLRLSAESGIQSAAAKMLKTFLLEGHGVLQEALDAADRPGSTVPAGPAQLLVFLGCILYDLKPFLWQFQTDLLTHCILVLWLPVLAAAAHLAAQSQGPQAGALANVGNDGSSNSTNVVAVNSSSSSSSSSLGDGSGGGGRSWDRLLREDDDAGLLLLGALLWTEYLLWQDGQVDLGTAPHLADACMTLAALHPDMVRGPTQAAAAAIKSAGVAGDTPAEYNPPPSPTEGEEASGLPLPLSMLSDFAARLAHTGYPEDAAALAVLASLVKDWAGLAPSGSSSSPGEAALLAELRRLAAPAVRDKKRLARLLGPPVDLASLLGGPTCANPLCTNLEGDSELGVRLQRCGRCGAVGYCCRECQTAHWRAGHKAECGARARGGAGGGAAAAAGAAAGMESASPSGQERAR